MILPWHGDSVLTRYFKFNFLVNTIWESNFPPKRLFLAIIQRRFHDKLISLLYLFINQCCHVFWCSCSIGKKKKKMKIVDGPTVKFCHHFFISQDSWGIIILYYIHFTSYVFWFKKLIFKKTAIFIRILKTQSIK